MCCPFHVKGDLVSLSVINQTLFFLAPCTYAMIPNFAKTQNQGHKTTVKVC